MTEVTVFRVWLNPRPDQGYVVIFKEAEGDRAIPMAIGVHEARAIQMAMDGIVIERPLTHDLFVNILDELDTELLRVEIAKYRDGTYYADLVLQRGSDTFSVDARPSDCAAIAVRCGAPILASEEVFQAADARVIQEEDGFTLVSGVESHTVEDHASGIDEDESQGDLEAFRRIITDADLEEDDS